MSHTLEASEREGSVPIGLDLRVDVRAAVEQQTHGRRVPVHGGQHQRRYAEFGTGAGVDFSLGS